MAGDVYPDRPQFFVLEFLRAVERAGAVYELGTDGVWLLFQVVLTEDRVRYARPVRYTNEMLMDRAGWSKGRLVRVRENCIRCGWLRYTAGHRGWAGTYFVTVPESATEDMGDAADRPIPFSDETESGRQIGANEDGKRAPSGRQAGAKRALSGRQTGAKRAPNGPPTFLDPKILDPIPQDPVVPSEARADAPKSRRTKAVQTPPPDVLPEASIASLEAWAAERYPSLVPEVRSLCERCLDHFRGKGESRADWVATCRTWIGNEAGFKGHVQPRGGRRPADPLSGVREWAERHADDESFSGLFGGKEPQS